MTAAATATTATVEAATITPSSYPGRAGRKLGSRNDRDYARAAARNADARERAVVRTLSPRLLVANRLAVRVDRG
jgi:hypothetical protein